MGDHSGLEEPLISLPSKDHSDLLNIIDNLRSQGISRFIDLPQLIVCGDQSSGKSSVLEAVSGIRFPTKDNLCTRFATELVLRRSPITNVSVAIVPSADRTEAEKVQLSSFQHEVAELSHFEQLVDKAKNAMGLDSNAKAFSNDILRVEVSGPAQPHLTLVDLPGLFQAGNKAQSDTDAQIVKELVLTYMRKARSVILAVVSAKNDFANQIVTKYAREVDPEGFRTLGIITKPDTLHAGSDSERSFIELAMNRDVQFRLGWHVLKNRDYDTRDCSAQERDDAERAFFSQGMWATLPTSHVGITSLKPRLSSLLREQILTELPSLTEDVITGIKECKETLRKLGEPRVTLSEQRLHLVRICQEFSSLMKLAVSGVYIEAFFGNPMEDSGYNRRLRAVTQNICLEFAEAMRRNGHTKEIVSGDKEMRTDLGNPVKIKRADYIQEVKSLMKRSRGLELPGTYNPLIIGDLFYEQSKNWAELAHQYIDIILDATRTTLNAILENTSDAATGDGLRRFLLNPGMNRLQSELEAMVESILEPHQRGHPITYNHYFTDHIQKAKARHRKDALAKQLASFFGESVDQGDGRDITRTFNFQNMLNSLNQATEADMDGYACSEATDCMLAYYKVAMKTFVDDFAVLAVEKCLLQRLPHLLSAQTVMGLDDATVARIAAESEESQLERSLANEKLKILEPTLEVLRGLDRHNSGAKRNAVSRSDSTHSLEEEWDDQKETDDHPSKDEAQTPPTPPHAPQDQSIPAPVPEARPMFGVPPRPKPEAAQKFSFGPRPKPAGQPIFSLPADQNPFSGFSGKDKANPSPVPPASASTPFFGQRSNFSFGP